ncbi:gp53-like domain-containing protein [Pseudomonas sp. MDT1-17]
MDYPISVPSVGLVAGKFVDENPLLGTPGSLIPAQWGNAVTQEILNILSAAGIAPSEVVNDQLLTAIRGKTLFVTQPQFDATQGVATTAFVQRALGNDSGFANLVGVTTLNASHAGKIIYAGAGGNYTVTLPSAAAVVPGTKLPIVMFASQPCFFVTQLAQSIYVNGGTPLSTITLGLGDSLTVESDGANWYAVGGSVQLKYAAAFGSSKLPNGYLKLPSGMIIQWGFVSVASTGTPFTFPIAFPNACGSIALSLGQGATTTGMVSVGASSPTGATLFINSGTLGAGYIAVGW